MATSYTVSFACLNCRKAFKRAVYLTHQTYPQAMKCPECAGISYNFGRHFKAPKRTNIKQWKKIEFLFQHGFRFQKIRPEKYHYGTVPYPETLEQAKEFVIKYEQYAMRYKSKNS